MRAIKALFRSVSTPHIQTKWLDKAGRQRGGGRKLDLRDDKGFAITRKIMI